MSGEKKLRVLYRTRYTGQLHADQLQLLVQQCHRLPKNVDDEISLRCYVYWQCLPKIQERLDCRIPGSSQLFKDFFSQISPDDFPSDLKLSERDPDNELDGRFLRQDEEWILDYEADLYPDNRRLESTRDDKGIQHIRLDVASAKVILQFFQGTLKRINEGVLRLIGPRTKGAGAGTPVQEIHELLSQLDIAFIDLRAFTNRSPSFLRLLLCPNITRRFPRPKQVQVCSPCNCRSHPSPRQE